MTRTKNSSLTNALRLLKSFSVEDSELSLSDIAEIIGVSKSTACRLVQTLESEGFIYQNTQFNSYSLGSSVLALSNTAVDQFEVIKETTRYLKNLSEKTKESSHIAILDQLEVIYLKKEVSKYRVELSSHIGKRNPAHVTSSGLAILSQMAPAAIERLFPYELEQFTKHSFTNLDELQKQLQGFQNQGYALSKGQFIQDIISIGAPIFNKQQQCFASVSVAGPIKRIVPNIDMVIQAVLKTSKEITEFVQAHERDVIVEEFI